MSDQTMMGREKILHGFFREIHNTIATFDQIGQKNEDQNDESQKIIGLTVIIATFLRTLATASKGRTEIEIIPNSPFEPKQTVSVENGNIIVDGDVTMVTNRYGQITEQQQIELANARIPLDLIAVAQLLVALTNVNIGYQFKHGDTTFERDFNGSKVD